MSKKLTVFTLVPLLLLTGCSASESEQQANLDRAVAVIKANESLWQFSSGSTYDENSVVGCAQIVSTAPIKGWNETANRCSAQLTLLEGKSLEVISVVSSFSQSTNDEFISDIKETFAPIARSKFTEYCEPSVAQELVTTGKSRCVTAVTTMISSAIQILKFRNSWGSFYNH